MYKRETKGGSGIAKNKAKTKQEYLLVCYEKKSKSLIKHIHFFKKMSSVARVMTKINHFAPAEVRSFLYYFAIPFSIPPLLLYLLPFVGP